MVNLINGHVSHWIASQDRHNPNAYIPLPLPTNKQNLTILGAGLTGLWLAYYAAKQHPDWNILVIEANSVGYGASGRNGGWLSPLLPGNRAVYSRTQSEKGRNGVDQVIRFQHAINCTITETLRVLELEGIEADQHQGGHYQVATTRAGLSRISSAYKTHLEYGYSPDQLEVLSETAMKSKVNIDTALGGLHFKDTVRIHPAKLTRGLADVVTKLGVKICTDTRAHHVKRGQVTTNRGTVASDTIISCLESYSGSVTSKARGFGKRELIPVNSAMIATTPLTEKQWDAIGWNGHECLNDAAHTFVYAQRTLDGRIAIGGRGAPYQFNSGTAGDGEVDKQTIASLSRRLKEFFPSQNLTVEHAWKGTIGVTRDWCAGVFFDPAERIGTARGFAGHGVTATNLAARTLLDRVNGESSPLTQLPWNDHDSGQWEPEPIRYVGVHAMYRLFGIADAHETFANTKRTSAIANIGSRLAGLHE